MRWGTNNISLSAISTALEEPSPYSLINACSSDNVNRWAKSSPLTKSSESMWIAPTSANYMDTLIKSNWYYNLRPLTAYKLGDFRNYTTDVIYPLLPNWPEKLKLTNNSFDLAIINSVRDDVCLGVNDIFGENFLKPCLIFSDTSGTKHNYTTNIWDFDLSGMFNGGDSVIVTFALCEENKELDEPHIANRFYSIKIDDSIECSRTYTIDRDIVPEYKPIRFTNETYAKKISSGSWELYTLEYTPDGDYYYQLGWSYKIFGVEGQGGYNGEIRTALHDSNGKYITNLNIRTINLSEGQTSWVGGFTAVVDGVSPSASGLSFVVSYQNAGGVWINNEVWMNNYS